MKNRLALIVVLAAVVSGCGQAAFSPHFRDNVLQDLENAVKGVKLIRPDAPVNAGRRPIIFLVTDQPTRILAWDLQRRKTLWEVTDDVSSKIAVGRLLIFHRSGPQSLVARRLSSGKQVWSVPLTGGKRLLGITTDGSDVYYVTEHLKRDFFGDVAYLVAVDGQSGKTRWIRPSKGRLGAPVALKKRLFLPFRFQSVSVLSTRSGEEMARVRSRDEMLLWVRATPAGVLYGGKSGIYRLDRRSISGSQQESNFLSAPLPSSVRPVYWWDGYNAALSTYTAYDRNRLLWQMEPGKMDFIDDCLTVHNYRFFFTFDAKGEAPGDRTGKGRVGGAEKGAGRSGEGRVDEAEKGAVRSGEGRVGEAGKGAVRSGEGRVDEAGKGAGRHAKLRWVYSFPRHDIVASVHTGKALVLVSDTGDVVLLDPRQGVELAKHSLNISVRGASFDLQGYQTTGKASSRSDLRTRLTEVIWDPDRRFGAVKLFAVEQLARLRGKTVSADLVKIVTHETIDPAVYKVAGQMIVDRHDKRAIPLYLKTLRSTFNFLKGTRAKAVDIMARALADLKARNAVKPLLKHLMDHETPIPQVEEIVKALITIGDRSVLVPFRDFLLTYRADDMFKKSSAALNLVADGLLKLGGEEERQLLSFVENDSQTIKPLRTYLSEALKQTQ